MIYYCVTLTASSDSEFMMCYVISFWTFILNSASALIHSWEVLKDVMLLLHVLPASTLIHLWEVLKDVMLLLQCSFCFCVDSLMRSYERHYVVAAIFFLLLRWFTPEKFWKDDILLLQCSLCFYFWMFLWSLSFWRMASFWNFVT